MQNRKNRADCFQISRRKYIKISKTLKRKIPFKGTKMFVFKLIIKTGHEHNLLYLQISSLCTKWNRCAKTP